MVSAELFNFLLTPVSPSGKTGKEGAHHSAVMRVNGESCKPQCLAQANVLFTGQLLSASPCLPLTVVALVGGGGQVASLSSSAKQAALYPYALWSSEQQRKTGSWVIVWFSNETLRFRRLSSLPKGMQLINGEARIKVSRVSSLE